MQALGSNNDYDWDSFDTESYQQQYKGGVMFEDRCLARAVTGALLELQVPLKSQTVGIDVGNGGVLRGPSLIAPFIRDDGVIVWSDYGEPQLESARQIIKSGRRGNLGSWAEHQMHMGEVNSAAADAVWRACRLGTVRKQSIFNLPETVYDIAITCFVPESLTGSLAEWEEASGAFFKAVKPGHPAVMLFMAGSTGYASAGIQYPAVPVNELDVRKLGQKYLDNTQTFFVAGTSQARHADDPHTYEGMGAIIGIKK